MSEPYIPLVVHVTHEAGVKLGGIGAVLDGFLNSPEYDASVARTILTGPINMFDTVEMERLFAPENKLRVRYSSLYGYEWNEGPESVVSALQAIETSMNVKFLYGTRTIGGRDHEILLVDAGGIAGSVINSFKFYLWQRWGLPCSQFEGNWEFSFFLNAGEPLFAGLQAITEDMAPGVTRYLIAHEWLGLPVVFSAKLRDDSAYRTIFYAHEVATARLLVEENEGHDTRFYNALRLGRLQGNNLDQVFGDHSWFYKHAMLLRAGVCDRIFAVGDPTVDELRFLGGVFSTAPIDLVFNGVPAASISLEQKLVEPRAASAICREPLRLSPGLCLLARDPDGDIQGALAGYQSARAPRVDARKPGQESGLVHRVHGLSDRTPRGGCVPLGGRVRLARRAPVRQWRFAPG